MSNIIEIESSGTTIAYVIRAPIPAESMFVTPPDASLQVGFIVKRVGMDIPRHDHKKVVRRIEGTCEVLVVKKGRCEIQFFDESRTAIGTREVSMGDVIVLLRGGHGFRIIEDTVFLEVKQGPYPGIEEKDHF